MKKFKFRFESVEKLRKSKESEALVLVGHRQRNLQTEKNNLAALQAEYEKATKTRETLANDQAVDSHAFALQDHYIQGLRVRMLEAHNRIRKANRFLEQALKVYLETRRQVRAMEVIRENDQVAYRKERSKWEQRMSDELTVMRMRLKEEA